VSSDFRKAQKYSSTLKEYTSTKKEYSSNLIEYSSTQKEYSSTLKEYTSTLKEYTITQIEYSSTLKEYTSTLIEYSSTQKEYTIILIAYSSAQKEYTIILIAYIGTLKEYQSDKVVFLILYLKSLLYIICGINNACLLKVKIGGTSSGWPDLRKELQCLFYKLKLGGGLQRIFLTKNLRAALKTNS